jgi:DNA-binding LacI/PurR family transcriptional regulator
MTQAVTPKKTGIRELARLVGVSTATVSNTFNRPEVVKPETRRRVVDAAKRNHYKPHRIAHALKTKRTQQLGLIAPTLSNQFYTDVVRNAQTAAWKHGFDLVLTSFEDWNIDQEIRACEQLSSLQVDGVIMLRRSNLNHDAHLRAMLDDDVKIVLIDEAEAVIDGMRGIDVDMIEGTCMAVDHLLELGHRSLMLVNPGQPGAEAGARPSGRRYDGIRHALRRAKRHDVTVEYVVPATTELDDVYDAVRRRCVKGDMPTGIIGSNDQTAAMTMAAMYDAGLRVPDDASIVGFDNTGYGMVVRPALTTVSQSQLDLGRRAVEQLIDMMAHADRKTECITLTPELVVRASTGPAPGAKQQTNH